LGAKAQQRGLMNIKLSIAAGLIICFSAQSALACRCEPPPLEDALAAAALVVEAKVSDLIELPEDEFGATSTAVILEVSTAWKAEAPRRIVVINTEPCRFDYDEGSSYLLYLQPLTFGLYATSRCDGSVARASAEDAIEWLGENATSMPIVLRSRPSDEQRP